MLLRSGISVTKRSLTTQARRLKYPISVAPMVDISTPYFLELLHIISGNRYAYYTEMHFSQAIVAHQTHLHAFIGPPRPNVVVQLGGSNPSSMAEAAEILEAQGYSEINVNVGCPSKAVQHGQFGAVLMKSPDLVADILTTMQKAVSIPITVKCRLGVDKLDSYEFLHEFVDKVSNTHRPLPHLIVHARKCLLRGLSPKQNRSIPPLNYDRVYRLAETFPRLPITINGGFNQIDSINMSLDRLDGCMVGRKIMDSPLFLQDLDRGVYNLPDDKIKTTTSIISEYLDYIESLPSHPVFEMENVRIPPLTIFTKPLTKLYSGSPGRAFRRHLMEELRDSSRSARQIVSSTLEKSGV